MRLAFAVTLATLSVLTALANPVSHKDEALGLRVLARVDDDGTADNSTSTEPGDGDGAAVNFPSCTIYGQASGTPLCCPIGINLPVVNDVCEILDNAVGTGCGPEGVEYCCAKVNACDPDLLGFLGGLCLDDVTACVTL